MNRNYNKPAIAHGWAETRETHEAVAVAIHAISGKTRTPESIWEAPTPAEWEQVGMAVAEYLAHGDFATESDGRYSWGQAVLTVALGPELVTNGDFSEGAKGWQA